VQGFEATRFHIQYSAPRLGRIFSEAIRNRKKTQINAALRQDLMYNAVKQSNPHGALMKSMFFGTMVILASITSSAFAANPDNIGLNCNIADRAGAPSTTINLTPVGTPDPNPQFTLLEIPTYHPKSFPGYKIDATLAYENSDRNIVISLTAPNGDLTLTGGQAKASVSLMNGNNVIAIDCSSVINVGPTLN
jgi:hypothetical protein